MNNNEKEKKESIEYLINSSDMFLMEDYNRIASQLDGHRYFLQESLKGHISWDEVAYSWMCNVYEPISQVMENFTTQMSFHGRRRADVFFELCDHLYYLSLARGSEVDAYEAVIDYDAKFGKTIGRILAKLLKYTSAA